MDLAVRGKRGSPLNMPSATPRNTRPCCSFQQTSAKHWTGTSPCSADRLSWICPNKMRRKRAARYHAVLRWLRDHQGWLVILDNVDTSEAAEAVEALVGSLQGGTVLITSRLADWSSEIPTLELDELVESAAVEFLLERTEDRRRRRPTDAKDAQALAHELGRLALALEQAGAFIAQKRSTLADYLARWRQRDEAVRKWIDERLTKYPRAVVTTWDTTVEQLSPEGLTLLRQLSWLAPEPIPRSLLPDGPAQDALGRARQFLAGEIRGGRGTIPDSSPRAGCHKRATKRRGKRPISPFHAGDLQQGGLW